MKTYLYLLIVIVLFACQKESSEESIQKYKFKKITETSYGLRETFFDTHGKITEVISYDGKLVECDYKYRYINSTQLEIDRYEYGDYYAIAKCTLDKAQNILVENWRELDESPMWKFEYTYNADNLLTKQVITDYWMMDGVNTTTTLYEYDENKNLVKESEYNYNYELESVTTYIYNEYDQFNNWTERVLICEDHHSINKRIIEYY